MSNAPASYEALIAARDAGLITRLEFATAARRHHRQRYNVAAAHRRQATIERRLAQNLRSFTRTQRRNSTEQLTIDATGANGEPRRRYAEALLKLPTIEARLDAQAQAHSFMNATASAGRPSDALASTVNRILAGSAR